MLQIKLIGIAPRASAGVSKNSVDLYRFVTNLPLLFKRVI